MLANEQQLASLMELFHTGTRLEYAKGEFLVRPGSAPNGVFLVESGLVKAYDITKYGEENLLVIRHQNEILGLTWAVTDENRDIIYAALAPTAVWMVSKDHFLQYIQDHPEAAIPVINMLTDMYRTHSERIMTLEYRTVRERLASFLLALIRRFGTKSGQQIRIEAPLRHQDIASSISSTRETTSRTLSEFEHRGILKTEQGYITILDQKALNEIIQ